MGAKLMACKEHEERYKKIVDNPMLYLEERQHQILPEEHQPEIHSLRFFGSRVEGATIEVLVLIDWAAEFVEISHSPVPEIPGFLRRPFIRGKLVKHLIPDDPAESIHKEKCIRTKAQKAWTYLCALLQFWTDEATTESGEVMYGGRCRPANPMIVWIRATLNPSFGDHFKITWASIAASTSWTQSRLYYGEQDRERFRRSLAQLRIYRTCWKPRSKNLGEVSQGGSAWDHGPELLYSILGRHSIQAPSVIRTARGSTFNGSRQCASRVHPYQSKDPGRTGSHQV